MGGEKVEVHVKSQHNTIKCQVETVPCHQSYETQPFLKFTVHQSEHCLSIRKGEKAILPDVT